MTAQPRFIVSSLFAAVIFGSFLTAIPARSVTLDRIISRENQNFQIPQAKLSVGRDGEVYVMGGTWALRFNPDGSGKTGFEAGHAARSVTANGDGVIAVVNAHLSHVLHLYTSAFTGLWSNSDFAASDALGFGAPCHVEAGASGDFYAADQYRDRILEFKPNGNLMNTYVLPRAPGDPTSAPKRCEIKDFRVCEKTKTLFILYAPFPFGDTIACVGFDGKVRWRSKEKVSYVDSYDGGGFDADEDGNLYVIESASDTISKYSPDGVPQAPIKLQMGDLKATMNYVDGAVFDFITDLRVSGGQVFIHRYSKTELYQRYDMATGKRLTVVNADINRLTVTYPGETWTAGQPTPFTIAFDDPVGHSAPQWRVWVRPLAGGPYRELPARDGSLQVPADLGGLYMLKVSPEVQPVLRGAATEFEVRSAIEVRQPGSKGTANVLTPDNRMYYGRGETIPFSVLLRAADADLPPAVTVRLMDGDTVLAEKVVPVAGGAGAGPASGRELKLNLPWNATAELKPGDYRITVSAPGLTGVAQPLTIGPGLPRDSFHLLEYGDYGNYYPDLVNAWDAPDRVADVLDTESKIGWNLVVERLGVAPQGLDNQTLRNDLKTVTDRLQKDPTAVAPEKALMDATPVQCVEGYGAQGSRYMSILMNNDAGLPILPKESTPGFDHRSLEQVMDSLNKIQTALAPYPAFRGWSWSSNWWIYEKTGAKAGRTPEEQAAYVAALAAAKKTGQWDPVLDTVADIRLGYAADFQGQFNDAISKLTPGRKFITASAVPYRNVEGYPPLSIPNVDETDLQAQWEQLPPAFYAPENVDFYTRPGKSSFSHPEVWNDNGSGDIMLTMLMSQVMRGADGIGISGTIQPWGEQPEDSRSGYNGLFSVYRAFLSAIKPYGPWLTTLKTHDQVAIIADGRMFKTEEWAWIMGRQFYRVLEAYSSCLGVHYPASIVFTEDLKPDTLKAFKAVILVSQTVEMEPTLLADLRDAKKAGVAIFADGLCRPDVVKEFTPLGISFNHFEVDKHQAGCDYTMASMLADCRLNEPAMAKALGAVATPPASMASDQVWLSERSSGNSRVLFVVNNTIPPVDPGELWRIDLAIANRMPLVEPVTLSGKVGAVYDLFAMKQVTPVNGVVQADLRYFPARIFAILPAPIVKVALVGPGALAAGRTFAWRAAALGPDGRPVAASIPMLIRLLDSDGKVLEEQRTAADGAAATGTITVGMNVPAEALTLEATELFGGKTARLAIRLAPAVDRVAIQTNSTSLPSVPVAPTASGVGVSGATGVQPFEASFGPHVRAMALADDGATAVMNTLNWDHNLYTVDLANGKVRWAERVGDYFTFAPVSLQKGFAVQGFSFTATEGYRLFLCDSDGKPQRGFGLYGMARRAIQRFLPNQLNDHINSFAAPANAAWVATAGDLGVAAWKADGTLLWSQDLWKKNRTTPTMQGVDRWDKARLHTPLVTAVGPDTVLVTAGMQATAYDALSGKDRWNLDLGTTGEIRQVAVSRDGATCAVLTDTNTGTIYVVRDGKLAATLPAANADTVAISADGSRVAMVGGDVLQYYTVAGGLQWTYSSDGTMHYPQFTPDGTRLAVSSALGTLYVLGDDGSVLLKRDVGGLAVPAWLPNGDLLLGTWEGMVIRLDGTTFAEHWRTLLRPPTMDTNPPAVDQDTPVTRITSYSNALPTPLPIDDNLLAKLNPSPFIHFYNGQTGHPNNLDPQNDIRLLFDGKTDAPPKPWLDWGTVALFAEQYPFNYIDIDTFVTQLHVTGITLVEDPAHPESWLRDVYLEYWDASREQWVYVQHLISDAAIHSHQFATPIDASHFRIVLPWGCCGNVRLGEIVFHGQILGHSNPDVRAANARAVLFDGQTSITNAIYGNYKLATEDSYDGKPYLSVGDDNSEGSFNMAVMHPTAGYIYPDWYVPIAEKPGPGEYRYMQFVWKAASPKTTGMALVFNCNSFTVTCGTGQAYPGTPVQKASDAVPTTWTPVTVDLWQAFGRHPFRIGCMGMISKGAGGDVADVVLGRTMADLAAGK